MAKMNSMRFCTAINCMDGRVQLPVIEYLQQRFDVEYVDSITKPGPSLILAERKNDATVQAILDMLKLSIEKHNSAEVAVVGHYDCAANQALRADQVVHIRQACQFLRQQFENVKIIGLWVDENWDVHEVLDT